MTTRSDATLIKYLRFILNNGSSAQRRAVEWFLTRIYQRTPDRKRGAA